MEGEIDGKVERIDDNRGMGSISKTQLRIIKREEKKGGGKHPPHHQKPASYEESKGRGELKQFARSSSTVQEE